jgi:hypothetical protein
VPEGGSLGGSVGFATVTGRLRLGVDSELTQLGVTLACLVPVRLGVTLHEVLEPVDAGEGFSPLALGEQTLALPAVVLGVTLAAQLEVERDGVEVPVPVGVANWMGLIG